MGVFYPVPLPGLPLPEHRQSPPSIHLTLVGDLCLVWRDQEEAGGDHEEGPRGHLLPHCVPALAHPPFRKLGPNPLPGQPLRFLSDTAPRPVPVSAPLGPFQTTLGPGARGGGVGRRKRGIQKRRHESFLGRDMVACICL